MAFTQEQRYQIILCVIEVVNDKRIQFDTSTNPPTASFKTEGLPNTLSTRLAIYVVRQLLGKFNMDNVEQIILLLDKRPDAIFALVDYINFVIEITQKVCTNAGLFNFRLDLNTSYDLFLQNNSKLRFLQTMPNKHDEFHHALASYKYSSELLHYGYSDAQSYIKLYPVAEDNMYPGSNPVRRKVKKRKPKIVTKPIYNYNIFSHNRILNNDFLNQKKTEWFKNLRFNLSLFSKKKECQMHEK